MTSSTSKSRRRIFRLLQLIIHGALFMLCLALAATYALKVVHDDYFVTLLKRARRTDKDLVDEYTYYDRQCNVLDITATKADASQLIIDSKEISIPIMMVHGAVMIPQLFSDSMIKELREFVVWKNNAVRGTDAEYRLAEGGHRISYGIEAAEHPTVVRALKAVHSNEKLKSILEGLMGRNPALTEITAITARYGSSHQPWHPDLRADGNGIQFGRTYSHSYSMFIPLQNTTGEMGATDVCPGTHYCADWGIDDQCEENKIGFHEIGNGGIWKAGDAVLFNQQIWHRGTQFSDPNAPERVVFILTFIGRPTDTRQLPRDPYFHMKWNMWGHTFQDLADADTSMARPWSTLRSLHLWKAKGREWGYDLFTAATIRIANRKLGVEPVYLEGLLHVSDELRHWLDPNLEWEEPKAWEIYIRNTIDKTLATLIKANNIAVAFYVAIFLSAAFMGWPNSKSSICSFFGSILLLGRTYGIAIALGWMAIHNIRSSPWARNISAGRTLLRPFPDVNDVMRNDPSVSKGPTTLPLRTDVLVGTRLASKTIGVYSRWHDFHPGNRKFMRDITDFGGTLFQSLERSLPALASTLVKKTIWVIEFDGGRFLQQDYRTGDWRLMSDQETLEYVRTRLFLGTNTVEAAIKEEIDYMIGDYRFGFARLTGMSKICQTHLQSLAKQFIVVEQDVNESTLRRRLASFSKSSKVGSSELWRFSRHSIMKPSCKRAISVYKTRTGLVETPKNEWPQLRPLGEVDWRFTDPEDGVVELIPATIVSVFDDGFADIALYGEWTQELGEDPVTCVSLKELRPRIQPVEGLRVKAEYRRRGKWLEGTIHRVRPSGRISISYDGGAFEREVNPERYIVK